MASWAKDVRVNPSKELVVDGKKPVRMTLTNEGDRKLTFKLRTTRFVDVKPTVGMGVLKPNGGKVKISIVYKSIPSTRPFSTQDRITVLVQELPENMTTEQCWKRKDAQAPERFVIPLKPPIKASSTSSITTTDSSAKTSATTPSESEIEEEEEEEEVEETSEEDEDEASEEE